MTLARFWRLNWPRPFLRLLQSPVVLGYRFGVAVVCVLIIVIADRLLVSRPDVDEL